MMKKLAYREMQEYMNRCTFFSGDTHNVNHDNCPAGTDTRQRLYITRTRTGTLLFYCHNCGGRGALFPKDTTINIHCAPPEMVSGHLPLRREMSVTTADPKLAFKLSESIATFFEKRHMTLEDLINIEHSYTTRFYINNLGPTRQHEIVYNQYDDDTGFVTGQQCRIVKGIGAKCYTAGSLRPELVKSINVSVNLPLLVLVEDMISALKIALHTDADSICLWGAKEIDITLAHKVSAIYPQTLVWFDMDNSTVNNAANANVKKLGVFTDCVGTVNPTHDVSKNLLDIGANHMLPEDIKSIVDNIIRSRSA